MDVVSLHVRRKDKENLHLDLCWKDADPGIKLTFLGVGRFCIERLWNVAKKYVQLFTFVHICIHALLSKTASNFHLLSLAWLYDLF